MLGGACYEYMPLRNSSSLDEKLFLQISKQCFLENIVVKFVAKKKKKNLAPTYGIRVFKAIRVFEASKNLSVKAI